MRISHAFILAEFHRRAEDQGSSLTWRVPGLFWSDLPCTKFIVPSFAKFSESRDTTAIDIGSASEK